MYYISTNKEAGRLGFYMGFIDRLSLRRKKPQTPSSSTDQEISEQQSGVASTKNTRLQKEIGGACLLEKCPNYSGVGCAAVNEFLFAQGDSVNSNKPPFVDDTAVAVYGTACEKTEDSHVGLTVLWYDHDISLPHVVSIALSVKRGIPITVEMRSRNTD